MNIDNLTMLTTCGTLCTCGRELELMSIVDGSWYNSHTVVRIAISSAAEGTHPSVIILVCSIVVSHATVLTFIHLVLDVGILVILLQVLIIHVFWFLPPLIH